jgi:hypothetical protein
MLIAFQHKKESVFPLTKALPSAPVPSPVEQPFRNVAASPAPAPPDGGVEKEETVSNAPSETQKKQPVKKKTKHGRKKEVSGHSHEKSDSMKEWKIIK